MPPPTYGGPSLPRSLLDQIGGSAASNAKKGRNGPGPGRRNAPTNRKEQRKLERGHKRSQRIQKPRFQPAPQKFPRRPLAVAADDEAESESDSPPPRLPQPAKAANIRTDVQPKSILKKSRQAPVSKPEKPAKISKEIQVKHISRREKERLEEDDAAIAALEKKLGIRGNKFKKSNEDGLDDILADLGDDVAELGKRKRGGDDAEWLKSKRRKVDEIVSGSEEEDDFEDLDEQEDDESASDLDGDVDEEEMQDAFSTDDDDASDGEDDLGSEDFDDQAGKEGSEDDFEDFSDHDKPETRKKSQRENPYVAPGSGPATAPGKYIPPSLRAAPASDAELTVRLRRQTQGLLNKLSEANLVSIVTEVEALYQNYPRQYVTTTVIDLLLGLLGDQATLMDTFLILHAGFIAAIYKAIGPDFGAQMVERLVERFDQCYNYAGEQESSSKEAMNLLSLMAQLYNLQVIGSELVFDYIRTFLRSLSELHTELLLRVVRSSGWQLRQDDPSSLKDLVLLLHKTVGEQGDQSLSVRTKFMIETINDLKNNKLKAGAATSAMTSEHLTKMRKAIGSMNARTVRGSEPLRIGLNDLRHTEKRGKWWLVGASWKGKEDQPGSHHDAASNVETGQTLDGTNEDDVDGRDANTDLLSLAKHARMNTSIRRAIFMTLMSASDYQDAHFKLLKLNLTRSQEREIPHVLLHCAGAEQAYNPYYTVIAKKFCGDRRLRSAFQSALWDLFRKMGEKSQDDENVFDGDDEEPVVMATMVNYAKLYGSLIASGAMRLNALKNLDFVYLQPNTKAFLEILFITILVQCSSAAAAARKPPKANGSASPLVSISTLFSGGSMNPDLVTGLRYFLHKVVGKTDLAKNRKELEVVKAGCKEAAAALLPTTTSTEVED